MGAVRSEPTRVREWTAARPAGAAWHAFDLQLVTYALLLGAIGLAMAYSNSVAPGVSVLTSGSTFLRGLLWSGIAVVMFAAAAAFDYRWLRTLAWPLYLVQLGLLVLTLAVGDGVGGAARWVQIGDVAFQFSEIAKILMIVVLANYLSGRGERAESLGTIVRAALLAAPPLVLVMLQPDLGTSLVFGAILVGMLFMAGASLRWFGIIAASLVVIFPILWTNVLLDYQKERLTSFLNPEADLLGSGYQLHQSQIAVGAGGWFGRGLTNGTQNQLDFLPVQTTDFVGAILAEELGFIGCAVVLLLFTALIWRILVAGWRSRDSFGLIFAAGLASVILFQLVVNFGMVIGIMPITGIPLPFISHGGASLISLAAGLGIIQSINVRQQRAEW
jgi:rod shape determining protein RodA